MQRKFFSILGITLMIALFIPQIIFAEDYVLEEDSYIESVGIPIPSMHIADIGTPVIGGTGCPDGSYKVKRLGNTYWFTFDKYKAETDSKNPYVSKTCNMTIPIEMEEGYQIGIGTVRYSGEAMIPTGGSGKLTREYYFGTNSEKIHKYYIPRKNVDYDFVVQDGDAAVVWSDCGGFHTATIETKISVVRPKYSTNQATMNISTEKATIEWIPVTRPCVGIGNAEPFADYFDESE